MAQFVRGLKFLQTWFWFVCSFNLTHLWWYSLLRGSFQLTFKFHLLVPAYLECCLIGSHLLNTLPHSRGRRFQEQLFQWLLLRSKDRLNLFRTTHRKHWRLVFKHVSHCYGTLAEVATVSSWFPLAHILGRSDVFEELWFDCLVWTIGARFGQISKRIKDGLCFQIDVLFITFDVIRGMSRPVLPLNAIEINAL